MLKKDNILLRIPELDDVNFILNMENDSSLWHLSNTHNPFSRFDIEQYVLSSNKDVYVAKQLRFMIDLITESGTHTIGAIDIFDFDAHNRRTGVGIILIENKRRKGLGGVTLDILIDYLFNHLNIHQIYCNIEADNVNSINLFISRRFVKSGIKKDWNLRNNKWIDVFLFQRIND